MKKISSVIILLATFTFLISCKKNESPTCTITSPATNSEINIGETIKITSKAEDPDGNIVEVRYYLDDEGIGSSTAFPYTFNVNTEDYSPGQYKLKAIASDDQGSTAEHEINLLFKEVLMPVAQFSVYPQDCTVGDTVYFYDESLNNPTDWFWSIGYFTTSQQNPKWVFNEPGSYDVYLQVQNFAGSISLHQENAFTVHKTPNADFIANNTAGYAPFTVSFTNLSEGNISGCIWDFGDGGSSLEWEPEHIYEEVGEYTVSLTVSNINGETSEVKEDYITVNYLNQDYSLLNVPGNYQDWDPFNDEFAIYSKNNDDIFEGYIFFNEETEYKFARGCWDENWGGYDDGTLVPDGYNLIIDQIGYYFINANLNALTYSVTKTEWSIIGSATPGGWDNDTDMLYDETEKTWSVEIDLTEGDLKFRSNHDWTLHYGDDENDGLLEMDGGSIQVNEAGNYKVILNLHPAYYRYMIIKN